MSKELLYNYVIVSAQPQPDVFASHPRHWTTPSNAFVKVKFNTAMFMVGVGVVIQDFIGEFFARFSKRAHIPPNFEMVVAYELNLVI